VVLTDTPKAALLARISRLAYAVLKFAPGQNVYVQVKAISLVGLGYRTTD
jgi:ABC-type molybdate transport system ATPase subunit